MTKKKQTYKEMVTSILFRLNRQSKGSIISLIKLAKTIQEKFKIKYSSKSLKYFLKGALNSMVNNKELIQIRSYFRLSAKLLKKLKQISSNKNIKTTINHIAKKQLKSTKVIPTNNSINLKKLVNKKRQIIVIQPKKILQLKYKSQGSINKNSRSLSSRSAKTKNKTAFGQNGFTKLNLISSISTNPCPLTSSGIHVHSTTEDNISYQKRYPAIWQYYDNNNFQTIIKSSDSWYDYTPQASDIVEDEWQRYIVNRGMNDVRAVKSGEWEYMVDFTGWKQTNIRHHDHKVRKIRRLDENGNVTANPYDN